MILTYRHAATTYAAVGEKWNTVKYAKLTAEYLVLGQGFNNPDVMRMKKLAKEPEMQWWWKKRVEVKRNDGTACVYPHH